MKEYTILNTPIKIGDRDRVIAYSASLISGEEQLLITRDCALFITDGHGGYLEFKTINSGLTKDEINNLITALDDEMIGKINDLNLKLNDTRLSITNLSDSIRTQLLYYITREEYNKRETDIKNSIELEKHLNRNLLDLFSEDASGDLLYNGKAIVADFDTTNLVRQNEFDSFKTEVNDSILVLDNKINQIQEEKIQEVSSIKTEIVDINKEILELKETTVKIEDSINDVSEHSSLPSFSINPTISRIS